MDGLTKKTKTKKLLLGLEQKNNAKQSKKIK